MIRSIQHKGLRALFETGNTAGVRPHHVAKLLARLSALDTAQQVEDLSIQGYRLHKLKGQSKDRWSIKVNGNWRITFEFHNHDAYLLNYEDYH